MAGSNPDGDMDVCVVQKGHKGKVQDKQDKETSTDEVQKGVQENTHPGGGRGSPHPSKPALGLTLHYILLIPSHSQGQRDGGVPLTTHPIEFRG